MKNKCLIAICVTICMSMTVFCTGCMTAKSFMTGVPVDKFANTVDNAIMQTDISAKVLKHLQEGASAKSLLILVDGFRANALSEFYDNGKGIARLGADGGIYFTKPSNIDTKAKVGIGTNMLSILTGVEPSEMDVFKSTDGKRVEPYSILTTVSNVYKVDFYTDNQAYLDIQLHQEIDAISKGGNAKMFEAKYLSSLKEIETATIEHLNDKLIVVALSIPYVKADGDYSLEHADYLSAIHNVNAMIESLVLACEERENEDWQITVASTFGGVEGLTGNKKVHNTTTFLASNKEW